MALRDRCGGVVEALDFPVVGGVGLQGRRRRVGRGRSVGLKDTPWAGRGVGVCRENRWVCGHQQPVSVGSGDCRPLEGGLRGDVASPVRWTYEAGGRKESGLGGER